MTGLVRPPQLRTSEARSASRLELFFDLAYILVVAEMATDLADDTNGYGLAQFAGLFALAWTSWVGFTLYANRFDTDDVVFRVAKLAATGAIAGCAAAASGATDQHVTAFTVCFLVSRVILVGLYARAARHVGQARTTITVYLLAAVVTTLLWAVSLAVPTPARFWLWAAVVLVDIAAPIVVTHLGDTAPLHSDHLPDRFALFVILSIGELLTAAVGAVHEAEWARPAVLIAGCGFVVAGALWWCYFDNASSADTHELAVDDADADADADEGHDDDQASARRHDRFVYGHLPLTGGVVAVAAAIEHLALHPDEPTGTAGLILCGGLAICFAGLAVVTAGAARSWTAVWPWPVAAVPLLLVLAALRGLPALGLIAVVAAYVVVVAAAGTGVRAWRSDR